MEEAGVAAGGVTGVAVPNPSQVGFCGRPRKSGSANIFQGVNLRQLRRLFQSAGEPDPERRARQVWGGRKASEGDGEDAEEEERLAQALVGLRVRARTRSGIRAESGRVGRGLAFNRTSERTDPGSDDEGVSPDPTKSRPFPYEPTGEEDPTCGPGKDPDRYLHRVRH